MNTVVGAKSVPSIIAKDMVIIGNLASDGEIHIDGHLVGDVRAERLIIGQSAKIEGTLYARLARISGIIHGEIIGQTVELTSHARVEGDISHDRLSIEAGAYIQGLCKRVDATTLDTAFAGAGNVLGQKQMRQTQAEAAAIPPALEEKQPQDA